VVENGTRREKQSGLADDCDHYAADGMGIVANVSSLQDEKH
jgi:hypothetical protein